MFNLLTGFWAREPPTFYADPGFMSAPHTPPIALVGLAAGLGNRDGGLKQVEKVGPNGETLIDYDIHTALHAGFQRLGFLIQQGVYPESLQEGM